MIEFITNLLFGHGDVNMAFLIPLIASAVGTGLGYLQKGQSLPRVDTAPAMKAMKLAGQIPSASTVMQQGRKGLGEQVGAMRSQISRLGRDTNVNPQALQEIGERMVSPLMSTYVQGMGRVHGQAIDSARARAMAAAQAAQTLQSGQMANANITAQETAMRPNPLAAGAMAGQLAGNIMNIQKLKNVQFVIQ